MICPSLDVFLNIQHDCKQMSENKLVYNKDILIYVLWNPFTCYTWLIIIFMWIHELWCYVAIIRKI